MKYCCEYAYWCPTVKAVKCYVHGGFVKCCEHEDLHECLADMYGSEDGLRFGDGFMCLRCGNYEAVGNPHEPAKEPGFPERPAHADAAPGWTIRPRSNGHLRNWSAGSIRSAQIAADERPPNAADKSSKGMEPGGHVG